MGLEKAIKYGKEKRVPYRKAKSFDVHCRNHNACSYCLSNRMIQTKKELQSAKSRAEVDE